MDDITKDSRFSHISQDPRFKKIPRREKKVKIDKRFQSMFKDKNFKLKYVVDKRGRPVVGTSSEDLKKYYDVLSSEDDDDDDGDEDEEVGGGGGGVEEEKEEVEEEEEEEKEYAMQSGGDYARGEVLLSDSSSDEESSELGTEEEEVLDHGWGELDRDAERTDEITNRLALCHMDWDRIRAVDLMVLFNSFLSTGEHIRSISIYPSEYGLKRLKEEEIRGPLELVDSTNSVKNDEDEGKEENEEGNAYSMEKLRQYQLNRLKYYYAVLVFDSPQTANKIYTECDGLEYESSATRLDLRFVPDDTTFDQEAREVCDKMPDISKYHPRYFTTTALQQAKVELTWDETNPERHELNQKLSSGQVDGISEADLRDYLASSSEDESGDEDKNRNDDDKDENTDDPVSKYRSLLREIEEQEEKKKSSDMGLEITWGVGLKDKATKLVQEKLKEKNNDLTPFEQYIKKQKEKKKQKKKEKRKRDIEGSGDEYSDDDIPSDIDMNDSYFQEEFEGEFKKKNKNSKKDKNNKNVIDNEDEVKKQEAELELLLMSDAQERNHFSLKSIEKQESESKKKQKRKKKKLKTNASEMKEDDFEVNVKDERFSALYSSHHFNLDPTDPHYHKTKGMEALRAEKIYYRQNVKIHDVPSAEVKKLNKVQKDPELSVLVKSIKRKTQRKESR